MTLSTTRIRIVVDSIEYEPTLAQNRTNYIFDVRCKLRFHHYLTLAAFGVSCAVAWHEGIATVRHTTYIALCVMTQISITMPCIPIVRLRPQFDS
ncbi:hypothetical protein BOO86_13705 [Mycobacterium sp. CBMA 234]|nr:hypothetical protein [Mycolicibacterium sp. CBMA 234]